MTQSPLVVWAPCWHAADLPGHIKALDLALSPHALILKEATNPFHRVPWASQPSSTLGVPPSLACYSSRWTKYFHKGPDSKYVRLCGPRGKIEGIMYVLV